MHTFRGQGTTYGSQLLVMSGRGDQTKTLGLVAGPLPMEPSCSASALGFNVGADDQIQVPTPHVCAKTLQPLSSSWASKMGTFGKGAMSEGLQHRGCWKAETPLSRAGGGGARAALGEI